MRCVVVASDAALVAACFAAADGAAGIDVVAAVPRSRVLGGAVPACEVLLVADDPGAPAAEGAEDAARACPDAAIVLLAEHADIEAYRSALRAGAGASPASPSPRQDSPPRNRRLRAGRRRVTDVRQGGVVGRRRPWRSGRAWSLRAGGDREARRPCRKPSGSRSLGARPDGSLADLAQAGWALASGIGTIVVEHPAGLRHVAGPPDPIFSAS
jgi:hypothetical protein